MMVMRFAYDPYACCIWDFMSVRVPGPSTKGDVCMRDGNVLDLATRLIEVESHSRAGGRERQCAEVAADWLRRHGIQANLFEVIDGRANLLARVGPGGGRRLMFNGHLDTISGEGMAFPAFASFVRDGKLYGRGACDMKGPLAAMMAAMVDLGTMDLGGEVLFTAVGGEEERSEGTEDLLASGERADFCVVGEPSGMEVHLGHRGLEWIEVPSTVSQPIREPWRSAGAPSRPPRPLWSFASATSGRASRLDAIRCWVRPRSTGASSAAANNQALWPLNASSRSIAAGSRARASACCWPSFRPCSMWRSTSTRACGARSCAWATAC